ncbi:hypothetical protein [Thermococcus stetteri]|uniref:hypothetical protein n=1 Tax=Thermococcus stetteri TaxID=49900 RepID=UPI001AE98EEE|nr:hypothetical protein [Thermococcus stetteri]MBP1910930.1 hypothetical protein [Thermococcus stetteri]
MEELMELLNLERKPALTPERRVKDFLEDIQRTRNGEEARVRGFLILRKPPNAPREGIYYILSPVAPSEMKNYCGPRAYLVIEINETTRIDAKIQSGEYVEAEGVLDAYPFGTLRLLHARKISPADYSEYWKDYRPLALSKNELESLISETIYANYELERAIIYSILTAPFVVGAEWLDGFVLSGFRGVDGSKNATLSLWETLKYIHSLLPWEMQLRRDRWAEIEDDGLLGIDFRFTRPSRAGPLYYVPHNKTLLESEVPVPKWALKTFERKEATFLTPRAGIRPEDEAALLAETPFVLIEPVSYERNRELEELTQNLIVTVILSREMISTLNPWELKEYGWKFEAFLAKNRREYGELFDALTLSGKVFNANLRYRLGARLLGSMARLEGKLSKPLITDLIGIYQELTDLWVNELPEKEKLRLIREYERYVGSDKLAGRALSIFADLESTRKDGIVLREEFIRALEEYGIRRGRAEEIVDSLLRGGYLYEPSPGKLKLIRW